MEWQWWPEAGEERGSRERTGLRLVNNYWVPVRAYSGVLLHRRLTIEEKVISKGPEHRICEGFELKRNDKCLRNIGLLSFEITHYIYVLKYHIAIHKCNGYIFYMFIKINRTSEMAHPIKMFSWNLMAQVRTWFPLVEGEDPKGTHIYTMAYVHPHSYTFLSYIHTKVKL